MITLYIDTTKRETVTVRLEIDGKKYQKTVDNTQAQEVLPLIEKLLKEKKIKFNQINRIKVNTGPGSFTGLRVGVSIANALSFALKIPVNNKKIGEYVEALYNKV